jgi:CRP-like cAMP-binding protein/succinate dehydrogenase/fumarate reductase-like Fe-S protein
MPEREPDETSLTAFEDEKLFARDMNGQLIRLEKVTEADYEERVTLRIDGEEVIVKKAVPRTDAQGNILREGVGTLPRPTTIYDAVVELAIRKRQSKKWSPSQPLPVPTLCHQEHMTPVGVCRVCTVEVRKRGKEGEAGDLVPACVHPVVDVMVVHTMASPDPEAAKRVQRAVRVITELLSADHLIPANPSAAAGLPDELSELKGCLGDVDTSCPVDASRFAPDPAADGSTDASGRVRDPSWRGSDGTSLLMHVDHTACILCGRCARACNEVKHNDVIGRAGKGYMTKVAFDLDDDMGMSSCVSCGECMVSCPTGALTFRQEVKSRWHKERLRRPGYSEVSSIHELKGHPLFCDLSDKWLRWNASSVLLRKVRAGEALCRQGEYGATAFVIREGRFAVCLQSEPGSRRRPGDFGQRVDEVGPEALVLGEMACLSHQPRTATVVAVTDGEVYEVRRNVIYVLQRNKYARTLLEDLYRERALKVHLRKVSFFDVLDGNECEACADFLKDKVQLLRVDPAQVIFRKGEPADAFYTIRLGHVKVSDGERVLAYLKRDDFFGEIGLLAGGRRTATCTALDDVELVKVSEKHFEELLKKFPKLHGRFAEAAKERLLVSKRETSGEEVLLGSFLEQGLFHGQRLLVLDLEACTRCDECTRACMDTHGGVTRLLREGKRFDKYLVASACRSCLDPYCLVGCPVDAIHRREDSPAIRIEDHCIGCGLCAENCPYGNINMQGFDTAGRPVSAADLEFGVVNMRATTCDLCHDIVGPEGEVSCVYACPHYAAFRWTGEEFLKLVRSR